METQITVVIPCFNRSEMISKAIKSVQKQSLHDWKLLIIDDASTDKSVEVIKKYLADKRIRLISLKENIGISKVMNQALEHIDTPYFVQLDSDDWLERNTLQEFIKAIKKASKKTALFYGNVRIVQKYKGKWKIKRTIRHRSFRNKYDFLQYLTYMLHPRCYRTEAVRSVGAWDIDDPFQGRIMEDRRICLKLIERYPSYWINKILYNRVKHSNQLTSSEWKEKRNMMRKMVIEKYLKKWGDKYQPIYSYRNGLLVIKELKRREDGRGEQQ